MRSARWQVAAVASLVVVLLGAYPQADVSSVSSPALGVGSASATTGDPLPLAVAPARAATGDPLPLAVALAPPSGASVAPALPFVASNTVDERVTTAEPRPVPASAPASEEVEREITVAVTGDVLPHAPVVAAARTARGSYDFVPLLRGVAGPIGDADLALCHLEVPLARGHRGLSSYPVFNAPPEIAPALAEVGYDGCSVASNHSFDQGVDGVRATLDALDDAGLGHAGTARTKRESRRIQTYDVDGVEVAHLSYTYGLNGFVLPEGRAWLVNTIRVRRIRRDARRARSVGANVVLVSLHWGAEYVSQPTRQQRRLAKRLLDDSHIDALIGHHAHVVQPIERVKGKVVVFGLGNLLSNQSAACCTAATQDGVVVELTLRGAPGGAFTAERVTYRPTMVRLPQRRVVLVDRALRRTHAREVRRALRASERRTRQIIGDVAERAPG